MGSSEVGSVCRIALAAIAGSVAIAAGTISVHAASAGRDCFVEIERGRGPVLSCEFPTRLTEQERADLKRLTREMVQDAQCVVSINIERSQVTAALLADHLEFVAPPQPVACEVFTPDKVHQITGTFAPRVRLQAGEVVEGTPGLANVVGVPSYLAWPVIQYVNRSASVRDGMLRVINGYRAYYQAKRTMAGRR